MARLTAISGLGSKSAAIFLVEIDGRRVLFDLGDGLERGDRPDLSAVGRVDAVVLSHVHVDHCGALDRLDEIGHPSVHATARSLSLLPASWHLPRTHRLPDRGAVDLLGLTLRTGRNGHAQGGVWLHLDTRHGGVLYTGDYSVESRCLPFDQPPAARTLLVDASYGDRDTALADQVAPMMAAARGGAVLCVPPAGRGPDMVDALRRAGLEPVACPVVAEECGATINASVETVSAETARPDQVIVAVGANAEDSLAADLLERDGFRFVFSSHVPKSSPAHARLSAGQDRWLPWNVHPRRGDILDLARACAAERVIPAFVDLSKAPGLVRDLGRRLHTDRQMEV